MHKISLHYDLTGLMMSDLFWRPSRRVVSGFTEGRAISRDVVKALEVRGSVLLTDWMRLSASYGLPVLYIVQ